MQLITNYARMATNRFSYHVRFVLFTGNQFPAHMKRAIAAALMAGVIVPQEQEVADYCHEIFKSGNARAEPKLRADSEW